MEGRFGWSSMRNEEFQEEDVWCVMNEKRHLNPETNMTCGESSAFASWRLPTAARMIPRSNTGPAQEPRIVHQSAPINVPDWSKIYGKTPKKASKNALWLDDHGGGGGGGDGVVNGYWDYDEDEDDVDCDGNLIPPHEWIAKKHARSQISSFSVCEGAGRTLKGRDLSRVRNAVLTKTGFLE